MDLDQCYEVCLKLVEEAGQIIASRNAGRKNFICKSGETDLLTETDQQVEKLLINGISAKFPSHRFIGEEGTAETQAKAVLTDDPTWIIDPVDGTMNFVHSFPHSCISIALWVNKTAEIAIVHNPMLKQMFTARKGQGAFYNGARMEVSGQKDLSKALITTELGTTKDPEKMLVVHENMKIMYQSAHGIRVLGSAALNAAMVALGAADANFEMGIHSWDVAAADLLVREAGGVSMDPAGGPFDLMSRRALFAATKELGDAIASSLKQYYPQPRDD